MNRIVFAAAATVIVGSAAIASAQQAGQAVKRDTLDGFAVHHLSGFHVVLVVGETQKGRSSTENLPEGAARALKEMGDFLPYKSYRVLDTQWTSCCAPSPTTASGVLQGSFDLLVDGKTVRAQGTYRFSITPSLSAANIPVRFVLTGSDFSPSRSTNEAPSGRPAQGSERDLERQRQDVQGEIETLSIRIAETRQRVAAGVVATSELRPLENKHASLKRRLADLTADLESVAQAGGSPIIDTSFTMNAGETVVVGTSKLGGEQALIAIVTAVRKSAASR